MYHVLSVLRVSRSQCLACHVCPAWIISLVTFSVSRKSWVQYFMCHFSSVWRVLSRVSRASRFQCPVCHKWSIMCVTFSVYGVPCLTYFVCHVLSVWILMSERLVCHIFSACSDTSSKDARSVYGCVVRGVSSMSRLQCVVCHVWSVCSMSHFQCLLWDIHYGVALVSRID